MSRLATTPVLALALAGIVAAAAFWLPAQEQDARPLPALVPPGALLYLEAKDFHTLLDDWNRSGERKKWLAGSNFGILSRSRLIQRLGEAQDQFSALAGMAPGMSLLSQVAGSRSAFAFYDFSSLDFVYLTRMSASEAQANDLFRSRASYQPRQVANIPFYVKSDAATHHAICFTGYRSWLVIATNEDRMAQTLALLAGEKAPALDAAPWFRESAGLSSAQGDLRLVYNLDELIKTPQFRTYWIQRNVSNLKSYTAGIADLASEPAGFTEQRALLRRADLPPESERPALQDVLSRVPQTSGLYRAWVAPDLDRVSEALNQVILAEFAGAPEWDRTAPQASLEVPDAGSAQDLETRIDQPPPAGGKNPAIGPLAEAIMRMQPVALAHFQETRSLPDGVFVMPESGVVIECSNVDRAAFEKALAQVAGLLQTGSLDPLYTSVEGDLIIVSRISMATVPRPAANSFFASASYVAHFEKAVEWPRYTQLFQALDRNAVNPEMPASAQGPPFFSGNVQSLGDTVSRLQSVSIAARDEAHQLRETIQYRLRTP